MNKRKPGKFKIKRKVTRVTQAAGEQLIDLASGFKDKAPKRIRIRRVNAKDVWASLERSNSVQVVKEESYIAKTRRRLIGKKNTGEARAIALLQEAGGTYQRECVVKGFDRLMFIDFMMHTVKFRGVERKVRVALEIDGSSHDTVEAKLSDAVKDERLLKTPFVNCVLRITVRKLLRMTSKDLAQAIVEAKHGQVTRIA